MHVTLERGHAAGQLCGSTAVLLPAQLELPHRRLQGFELPTRRHLLRRRALEIHWGCFGLLLESAEGFVGSVPEALEFGLDKVAPREGLGRLRGKDQGPE